MKGVETETDRPLRAPAIHGEEVPMHNLSHGEVDFCVVGAGAAGA